MPRCRSWRPAPGGARFRWITDFLPAEVGQALSPLIEQGSAALKANLESRSAERVGAISVTVAALSR